MSFSRATVIQSFFKPQRLLRNYHKKQKIGNPIILEKETFEPITPEDIAPYFSNFRKLANASDFETKHTDIDELHPSTEENRVTQEDWVKDKLRKQKLREESSQNAHKAGKGSKVRKQVLIDEDGSRGSSQTVQVDLKKSKVSLGSLTESTAQKSNIKKGEENHLEHDEEFHKYFKRVPVDDTQDESKVRKVNTTIHKENRIRGKLEEPNREILDGINTRYEPKSRKYHLKKFEKRTSHKESQKVVGKSKVDTTHHQDKNQKKQDATRYQH